MTTTENNLYISWVISIHMPHTWHDTEDRPSYDFENISIHMPHTWHDLRSVAKV